MEQQCTTEATVTKIELEIDDGGMPANCGRWKTNIRLILFMYTLQHSCGQYIYGIVISGWKFLSFLDGLSAAKQFTQNKVYRDTEIFRRFFRCVR